MQKPGDTNEIEFIMQKIVFILNESIFKLTATFGISLKFEFSDLIYDVFENNLSFKSYLKKFRSLNLSGDVAKRLENYYLTQ
jgi:hypothetical protein